MATIEELQAQIAALSARVDALTVPPNRYYSSRYTGETIDKLLTSIIDIDEVLLNKADRGERWLPESWMTIPVEKRLWFYTGGKNGYYLTNNGTDFEIRDHDNHLLMSINYSRPPQITDGTYLAIATPSQEYDLPLADEVIALYKCRYRKDQFGNIVVKLAARITGASSGLTNVATLPEGYRPSFDTEVPAIIKPVATGTYTAGTAKIQLGAINVNFVDTGNFEVYINCTL